MCKKSEILVLNLYRKRGMFHGKGARGIKHEDKPGPCLGSTRTSILVCSGSISRE